LETKLNNAEVFPDRPVCAVCGKDTETGGSFMRLHLEGRRVEFCTPQCVRTYRAEPGRMAGKEAPREDGWSAWAVRWGP
jgi:ribosomal protein L24E